MKKQNIIIELTRKFEEIKNSNLSEEELDAICKASDALSKPKDDSIKYKWLDKLNDWYEQFWNWYRKIKNILSTICIKRINSYV